MKEKNVFVSAGPTKCTRRIICIHTLLVGGEIQRETFVAEANRVPRSSSDVVFGVGVERVDVNTPDGHIQDPLSAVGLFNFHLEAECGIVSGRPGNIH